MRISSSKTRRRSNKRLFREAKGNYSGQHRLIRTVQVAVIRGRAYAYRDRRARKRDFRRLWITRLSAACALRGLRYSTFIHGLKLANVDLNRKVLSELAIHEPAIFDEIVSLSRASVG